MYFVPDPLEQFIRSRRRHEDDRPCTRRFPVATANIGPGRFRRDRTVA
jgi:hypothetical protein